jgi:hypothetical protein
VSENVHINVLIGNNTTIGIIRTTYVNLNEFMCTYEAKHDEILLQLFLTHPN